MKKLEDVLQEKMEDPEFKKEWDALEPEFRRIRQSLNREGKKFTSPHRLREFRQKKFVAKD